MLHDAIEMAKRSVIQRAVEQAGQDHVKAAHLLGVHPNYLYSLIKKCKLSDRKEHRCLTFGLQEHVSTECTDAQ